MVIDIVIHRNTEDDKLTELMNDIHYDDTIQMMYILMTLYMICEHHLFTRTSSIFVKHQIFATICLNKSLGA